MATITDYLTQLQADKQALVDNLNTMEVEVSDDETFTTLVPKVLDIETGVPIEDYFIMDPLTQIYGNAGVYAIKKIPLLDTSQLSVGDYMFSNFKSITEIPLINTTNMTTMKSMFNACESLITIPALDTQKVTDMTSMFNGCISLSTAPLLNTSKVKTMNNMFYNCISLEELPNFDMSSVTSAYNLCYMCSNLTKVPVLNLPNCTSFNQVFRNCKKLTEVVFGATPKITSLSNMFEMTDGLLERISEIDCQSVTSVYSMFGASNSRYPNLVGLGGFLNLGQAYSTTQSANHTHYNLSILNLTSLTEQSLINVLTKVYDIKTKGCNAQNISIGATNLAKLTSTEGQAALVQATEYGWTVS